MPGVEKGMGVVVLRVVQGKTLLRMYTAHRQLSPRDCGAPERVVGLQEEGGVLLTVGQAEELLSQLVRCLQPALRRNRTKRVPSAPGRAEASRLPADTALGLGCRLARLLEPQSPWWLSQPGQGRFAA